MKFKDFLNKQYLYKLPSGDVVNEEYFKRVKSTVPGKGRIELFKNPTPKDHKDLGKYIRFTADNKKKALYAWKYDEAHHKDISKAVGIKHSFNDPDLLTGVAEWKGGRYVFHSADFLKDFKKMVGSERSYLEALIYNDWGWVNKYVKIDDTLETMKSYIK